SATAAPLTAALLPAALPAELARSGFWEHLSQLTGSKGSAGHSQGAKLGKDIANTKESIPDGISYAGNFLEKLAPLHGGVQRQPPPDWESLRGAVGKELESLRVKLSPHAGDVQHEVGRHLEELRHRLQPLTAELLEQLALKARELRRHLTPGREAAAPLPAGAGQRFPVGFAAKAALQPHADRRLSRIHGHARALHRNAAPHARAGPQQLHRELSAALARNARGLRRKIRRDLEQLRAQLSRSPGSLREPPAAAGRHAQELAREVRRRVAEFRRDAHRRIQGFRRAL
ncbi:APOA5 protein, partial [Corythaixoides concolor]|nr:APOA5 protein [Corythaixoides concolor]